MKFNSADPPGSAINLLTGKVDVAAFCDTCVGNYVELAEGEESRPGAIYRVKDDAPNHSIWSQEKNTLISVTPVLNAPFAVNTDTVSGRFNPNFTRRINIR